MPRTPDIIVPPKEYYEKQRLEGYSDWPFAFFRELFQNSVDAQARAIHIGIADVDGRGAFGRQARIDRAVRISFSDDGTGMSESVLRDVFFRPGRSTKTSGNTTGGFGTARVTLCFSQDNYRGHTGDIMFEGDGAEYVIMTVAETAQAKRDAIQELDAQRQSLGRRLAAVTTLVDGIQERRAAERDVRGDLIQAAAERGQTDLEVATLRAEWDEAGVRLGRLRADLAVIEAVAAPRKGCRFEIDINPQEGSRYRWVNRERLLAALDEYLSLSQVPCKVFLDGEEVTTRAVRGPKRRVLMATMPDGTERPFATVHISAGDRAKHIGKVIVRVDGACMFTQSTVATSQVIIEIDKSLAREVLTETRDGFKSPYDRALSGFRSELELDVKSALADREKSKHVVLRGGRGVMKLGFDAGAVSFSPRPDTILDVAAACHLPLEKARTEHTETVYRGAPPQEVVDRFIAAVAGGEETFLAQWVDQADCAALTEAARSGALTGAGPDDDAGATTKDGTALKTGRPLLGASVRPEFAAFVEANLAARCADAGYRAVGGKYADLHDIHIYADDLGDNTHIKDAMRRWNPDFWAMTGDTRRLKIGRGMSSHRFLAAWTVCCEYALLALKGYAPHRFKSADIAWATGFYFGKSENRYTSQGWQKLRTGAMHRTVDGVHALLVNPVFDDGNPAFDINKDSYDSHFLPDGAHAVGGLRQLEALALHEACHIFEAFHDEEFSTLLTGAIGLFDRAAAREKMRTADAAVQAAYGKGRTLVQAMDDGERALLEEEGATQAAAPAARKAGRARPADKLLAHSARTFTATVGLACAPENHAFPADTLKSEFLEAVTVDSDGVRTVDCDRIQAIESTLAVGQAHDWDSAISLAAFDDLLASDLQALEMSELEMSELEMSELDPPATLPPVSLPGTSPVGRLIDEDFSATVPAARHPDFVAADRVAADRVAADRVAADRVAADRAEIVVETAGTPVSGVSENAAPDTGVKSPNVAGTLNTGVHGLAGLDDALDALRAEMPSTSVGAPLAVATPLSTAPAIVAPRPPAGRFSSIAPVSEADLPPVTHDEALSVVTGFVDAEWDMEMFDEVPAARAAVNW